MRRVDLEVNRLSVDTLVGASNSRCLILDFSLDITKICEPPAGDMVELCPLGFPCSCRGSIRVAHGIGGILVFGNIDQLKNQWTSSNDATASGKEVAPDNIFEN